MWLICFYQFTPIFILKDYPSCVEFETLIIFTKKLILLFQMSGQRKSLRK